MTLGGKMYLYCLDIWMKNLFFFFLLRAKSNGKKKSQKQTSMELTNTV